MTDPIDTPPAAPPPTPGPVTSAPPPVPQPADSGDTPKVFAEDYVKELRAEAAKSRAERNELRSEIEAAKAAGQQAAQDAATKATQELTQSWGKALGFVSDDTPVDPQVLLEQAKAAQTTAEQQKVEAERTAQAAAQQAKVLQVEAELYRRATTAGADPLALIDSRTFMQRADVTALDPGSPEFGTAVDAVIRSALDADPRYRAGRVAVPRSGGNLSAGNGDPSSGSSTTSVQSFLDEKFKELSGGKGGKVHSRFLRGQEHGTSAEPMIPGQG